MAPATVREHLARVLAAEAVPFDDGSLRLLARAARGSMRDGLSLTDQAIAYGGGRLHEDAVRAMLGSVGRGHARSIIEALARRDGPALLAEVDGLRGLALSAAATLEEIAVVLQQMAVEQAVPGALDAQDPDTEDARALAPALLADETQLLYSMALHGRDELSLMSDEYAALTMVLLRFLAFAGPGGATPLPEPVREPRAVPLRALAPPALTLPALPATRPRPAPALAAEQAPPVLLAVAVADEIGDLWDGLIKKLCEQGALAALVRELATQAGLRAIDASATPPCWHLVVEREPLRTDALRDKLTAVLAAELGHALRLDLEGGVPADSPARRDAALRQRRQAAAEAEVRADPVVRELLDQFKSARIVPGSIKPT
jgi:DNA polymerase-3 subunit gamma/tau